MEPDEILQPSPEVQEVIRVVQERGNAALQAFRVEPKQALALLAIGAVGGAVGARVLKGAIGVTLGLGAAAWAYHVLTSKKDEAVS